ncbi:MULTISPECIES: hypothetical protein [Streptomyces]|uniref:hypothetical protein n=1 Tax=Streptomyces TaxID=1883 RepID=UPI001672DDBE|nr:MULTISPECIES: hypothetical protein [Streptomyces]MBK3525098.1 hypothetical protein [Streptomyces sp. MBT70]GGR78446.1 hypothetical protein GCM10010236_36520 [Streptomyces eurythermus]
MDRPLLSPRSALVLLLALLALLAGATVSGLTAVAGEGAARGLLAGLAAAGLAVPFFNRLIAAEDGTPQPPASAGAGPAERDGNG